VALIFAGCDSGPARLTIAMPDAETDRDIASSMVALFAAESDLELRLSAEAFSEADAMTALQAGSIDLAIISNSMPYDDGIATVIPFYPTILHIGARKDRPIADLREMLAGARVYAGGEGSASRRIFERMVDRLDLPSELLSFAQATENLPDLIVVFAPISPERMAEFPDYRLIGLGPPQDIGRGSIVDAAALTNPYFKPFVIPSGTYGDITPEPVLTLAVDKMLVARSNVEKSVVYDLINEILRLRPALAAQWPGLFQQLTGDFDVSRSTFVLHEGSLAYLQRSAPSVLERYSGIAEVAVTILIALASALLAAIRIFRMRRKNRIDTFYAETIRLRNSITESTGHEARQSVAGRIRELQNTAFELLVDEKLAADDSFRIFITLSNDVLAELEKQA
jgi:TRAP-type uncharacterized transport system substrate-binding protein